MAVNSGLFNSVNGDRKYNAFWFAQYFASFIGNGVFPNPSTGLQVVEGTNMQTVVKAGKGWINGYYIVNDADYILQHDIADGVLKRIDRVVIRLNFFTRTIDIAVKKGTVASSPVAPTLQRDTDYHELALADVFIANGATQIKQANITDLRLNSSLCGIVHGVVDQVDTTTIFNQYNSWFGDFTVEKQTDFKTWIDTLKDILAGDVAANLANRITNLEGTVTTHFADYVKHLANGGATSGTASAYTCNSSPNPTVLVDKMGLMITVHVDSGANPTLKWGAQAAKSIKKPNGSAAILKKDGLYTLRYNSVNDSFTLQGEGGEYGNVIAKDVRKGKTFGTENGIASGTLDLTDLTPSNLRYGVTIDGVEGGILPLLPGENEVFRHQWAYNILRTYTEQYMKVQVSAGAVYRIKYSVRNSTKGDKAFTQIYVNGVPKGLLRSSDSTGYMHYVEDIHVPAGAVISVGAYVDKRYDPEGDYYANIQPLSIHLMPITFTGM